MSPVRSFKMAVIKEDPNPKTSADGVIGGVPDGNCRKLGGTHLSGSRRRQQVHLLLIWPGLRPLLRSTVCKSAEKCGAAQAIFKMIPFMPTITRAAHVRGTVRIEAIIDDESNVVPAQHDQRPHAALASAPAGRHAVEVPSTRRS